jgi:hypothetical protein
MGRYTATFRPVAAWVQILKRFKFQGARHQLAAAEQPPVGSVLEPARLETAGDTPWGLTLERRPPSRTKDPGTSTEACRPRQVIEPAEAPC